MPRFLRFLRIAFSATCLIACVLLIVLWVRSYWRLDVVDVSNWYEIDSVCSEILVMKYDPTISLADPWSYFSFVTTDEMAGGDWRTTLGFKRSETPVGPSVVFPHWFPIFLLVLLAGIPWLKQFQRFTLRTLLIATTLVAVVLGLIVYVTRQ
jgi:hypothetical protein